MLVEQGGNIGVGVGEDGVFLIDDQFVPLTEKILRVGTAAHSFKVFTFPQPIPMAIQSFIFSKEM